VAAQAETLTIAGAIPIVMGANIGTSVTNTIVSLVHLGRRDEFRRAFAGAIVHDLFNWCTVLVLFPLEYFTGYLGRLSRWITDEFFTATKVGSFKPVDVLTNPMKKAVLAFFEDVLKLKGFWLGVVLVVVSLVMLFAVLTGLTRVLKKMVVGRLERVIDRFLFRNALMSYILGLAATALVQSSSVTTSMAVPLLGAGLLTVEQVYPYTLGANVGTTVTAFIASLAGPAGFTVALVHLLFNVHGAIIFYPLRCVPIGAAKWYAKIAAAKPRYAALFIIVIFFALPLVVIGVSTLLRP